jgi:hypothetical protein
VVEHLIGNEEVECSIHSGSTIHSLEFVIFIFRALERLYQGRRAGDHMATRSHNPAAKPSEKNLVIFKNSFH